MITSLAFTASAAIGPVDSILVTTNSGGSGDQYVIEEVTVDTYTVEAARLVFGVSSGEVGDYGAQPNDIVFADDYDLNTIFGRDAQGINPDWVIRSFGGEVFTSLNGSDPDFFVFEAGGDDVLEARAIPVVGLPAAWVLISSGAGNNWGDTGVVKTSSNNDINNGQTIYGIAFDITDLGVAEGTSLQGIDLRSATIDGASVLAAVPEPSMFALTLLGAVGLLVRSQRR